MSPVQFKLIQTGPGALTRRVTFLEQPTWFALASRIESLYSIPIQDVGVSYIDTDGDEITLSTHEELQDYYATVPRVHNNAIKFTVKNIGALRAQQRPLAQSPGANLFDMGDEDWQGLNIPGFPRVAVFARSESPPPPPPKSPSSAFVETVDDSSVETEALAAQTGARSRTSSPLVIIISEDKGKTRELLDPDFSDDDGPDDASSVVSVLHDDLPEKQPVHVYEFDTERGYIQGDSRPRSVRSFSRSRSRSPPIRRSYSLSRSRSPALSRSRSREMSPIIIPRSRSLSRSRSRSPLVIIVPDSDRRSRSRSPPHVVLPRSPGFSPKKKLPSPPVGLFDPPTPVLCPVPDLPPPAADSTSPPTATFPPSLTNDVAELLGALTDAFGSHPELSEGLKNIVKNATQGAYWAAERDSMVNDAIRAAESAEAGVARAAERAQEEAGRKVAEALGGVFRALGSIVGSSVSSPATMQVQPEINERVLTPDINDVRGRFPSPQSSYEGHIGIDRSRSKGDYQKRSPSPGPNERFRPRSQSPPPVLRRPPSPPSRAWYPPRRGLVPPPGPPPGPPPHHHRGPLPPPNPSLHHHHHGPHPPFGHPLPRAGSPPRHGPPFFDNPYPYMGPPMWGSIPPIGVHGLRRSSTLPGRFGPGGSRYGPGYRFGSDLQAGPPPPPPPPPGPSGAISSSARKAQLEEAKQYYKAKKEEWRREKEERRKEKERREMLRTERLKRREGRAVPRPAVIYSEGEDDIPPPIPPHPVELRVQAERNNGSYGPSSTRLPSSRDNVMSRLGGMGFTPNSHPQLEALVDKHLKKGPESNNQESLIANILEDLFLIPIPEASGSGSRAPMIPIPGAWKM